MADAVKVRRAYDTSQRAERARATRQRIAETALGLFLARGYNAVTMSEIATEAGVAYQTVYAVFGNKQRLAHEIIWTTFEVEGVHQLLTEVTDSPEPEVWLRGAARIVRLVSARLGGLLTFLRESGDPALLAEYQNVEARRHEQERQFVARLAHSGSLNERLTENEALDVLWTLSGSHLYQQLVDQQGWTADRYEEWLGDAMVTLLLGRPPR